VANLSIRRLSGSDASGAHALSAEIGWTQTVADWRLLLARGGAWGGAEPDGRIAATAAWLGHGALAWLCMVIVRQPWRRRGVATDLVRRVLADIDAAGAVAGLDARAELVPFYERFGFRPVTDVVRLRAARASLPAETPDAVVRIAPLRADEVAEMADYDARSSGADRAALLTHLHGRRPDLAFVARAGEWAAGYVLGRDGRGATQIGPLVAEDDETAIALAARALANVQGPAIVDAPAAQRSFIDWLAGVGFAERQPFVRMLRGREAPLDQADYIFAAAGLDFG
jgi:predicted N-acetyltransferase YhbS